MADDRCPVTEMDRTGCAHCRPPAERARLNQLDRQMGASTPGAPSRTIDEDPEFELGTPIAAKYHATCPACRYDVEPGDIIRRGRLGWIHTECT